MSALATPHALSVRPLALVPRAPEQRVVLVEFRSAGGSAWHAIGGGPTPGDAIDDARASCPPDETWTAVGWNDLYGE